MAEFSKEEILKSLYDDNALPSDKMELLRSLEAEGALDQGLSSLAANRKFVNELTGRKPILTGAIEEGERQIGLTGRYAIEGAAGLVGIGSNPIGWVLNQLTPGDKKYFEEDLQGYVSRLLDEMGVPAPQGKAEKIVGEITRAGFSAATGAGLAGMAAKGATGATTQAVAKALAQEPGQQIAGAMGSAAGQQAAQEVGLGPVGQIAASIGGGIIAAPAGGVTLGPMKTPAGLAEAEKAGIRVLTSDVAQPKTVMGKAAQAAGERIPLAGTGGWRKLQQAERVQAVKDLLLDYGIDDAFMATRNATDDVTRAMLNKRKADLEKYVDLKSDVINRLDQKGIVPLDKTLAKVDEEIAMLEGISPTGYQQAIAKFQEFKNDISGKTLFNVEKNRALLGKYFKDPNLVTIRDEAEKAVGRIYGTMREEMGDFIKQAGEKRDYTKWRVANARLSNMADELDISILKNVLKTGGDTPENVRKMLFSKKPSEQRLLYKSLDPAGRANARTAIMQEALEKADGLEHLSPQKFMTQLKKLGSPIGVFFSGKDLQQVQGIKKALELTRRASESPVLTQTGMQTLPYVGGAVLADLFGTWGGAVAGAGLIGGAARAFESKPMRDLLIKLGAAKSGTKEEAMIVKRLIALAQQYTGEKKEQTP